MSLQEILQSFYQLQSSGIKLGLENMRALSEALSHPEEDLEFIHVAGTNGKGTCCAVLESILRNAGYRTGLFISPHLLRFNERIQIAGESITDDDLVAGLKHLQAVIQELKKNGTEVTFFEASTGLALHLFRQKGVEIVVWETGLGGRLDSTNIVNPLCSIITAIGKDHSEFLGQDLVSIAGEKAGIIKKGRPVVYLKDPEHPEVDQLFEEKARALGSSFQGIDRTKSIRLDRDRWSTFFGEPERELTLCGESHAYNAQLALAGISELKQIGKRIPDESIEEGLKTVKWAGRFQRLRIDPPLVLDGAHNPQSIECVLKTWNVLFGAPPGKVIFGCLKEKDYPEMIERIDHKETRIELVPVNSPRSLKPNELHSYFVNSEVTERVNVQVALDHELQNPSPKGCLVTGSLFLAAEVLQMEAFSNEN
ncbi:MAG: folylpolyglutamate synthase/dihydrofolate synthase family protein [Verrucomicrobiota bacterium]